VGARGAGHQEENRGETRELKFSHCPTPESNF